jgi:hypothetical protein
LIKEFFALIKAQLIKHHPHNTNTEREIIMKLEELLTINNSIKDQLTKIDQEIIAKLADLQAAIDQLNQQLADVELTAEQAQSVQDVQDAVQALDDIIPDAI